MGIETGCSRNESQVKVTIGYLPITASLPLYAAVENGYFDQVGIQPDMVDFPDSNTMMLALKAGNIDIAACPSAIDVLMMADKSPGQFSVFRAGYTTQRDFVSAVIVPKDSSCRSLSDLAGKKIATFPGVTMEFYTKLVFQNAVGTNANVTIIAASPLDQLAYLEKGIVDALVTLEPTGATAEMKGVGQYLEQAVVERYVADPWVAGFSVMLRSFVDQDPKLAEKCVMAMNKGVFSLRSKPADAVQLLCKYTKLPESIAQKAPVPISWTVEEFDRAPVSELIALLREHGLLKRNLTVEDIMYR